MTYERDGVVLLRDRISMHSLADVVREYEAQTPIAGDVPKHVPIVIYWMHAPGERKRFATLGHMTALWEFIQDCAAIAREFVHGDLRLLETIVFDKPPNRGTQLRWHQDVSYFPFEPNNQIALWLPFEKVTLDSGALLYALGSHKSGLRASTDLHSGEVFKDETREPIPDDPAHHGYEVKCMEMDRGDVLLHDGRTWHTSGPNTTGNNRRGLSIRFLVGDTYYHPRPGSAAAFMKQIDIEPGDKIDDPAFPLL